MKLQKFEKKLRIFQVFKFSIRAEIKNLETLEFLLFLKLNKFLEICKFQASLSEKTTLKFLSLEKILQFFVFPIWLWKPKWKLGNLGNFQLPKVENLLWKLQVLKHFSVFWLQTYWKKSALKFQSLEKIYEFSEFFNFSITTKVKSGKCHKFWNLSSEKNSLKLTSLEKQVFDFKISAKIKTLEISEIFNYVK